ncbi:MCE-family protein MCE1A [Mycobacterium sp. Root135]|uniref:MCE family protein n=1 Tax=Mycobacterium sp. Root135 TaxID=1736457 RepID=UPI0006F6825C|nr:MCE-family protein MCE1A [Mycobacterium sp. Root135]
MEPRFRHWRHDPPVKTSATVLFLVVGVVVALVWCEFRGVFSDTTQLTLLSPRSGLSTDPGSKVTYNGVEIGRVATVGAVNVDGTPMARLALDVARDDVGLLPANVDAEIKASTVFGNKYVALSTPAKPDAARVSAATPIRSTNTSTEFNTLFETVVEVAHHVDPVKLNQTLTATAQALSGLGSRFGESIENGNAILADVNPLLPRAREDNQRLADLADVYSASAPDLFDGLTDAVVTAGTLNERSGDLDAALMAAVGFGSTAGDVVEKGAPYLVRGVADLVPTSALLDEYSPELFCTIRNYHDVEPAFSKFGGGNGYSLNLRDELVGPGNAYVYPDNLPRVNARGGPEGRPGCWQPVTRDLWPMPYLVMDTGASIAPYNHLELGQPLATETVWGRQIGEYTINP